MKEVEDLSPLSVTAALLLVGLLVFSANVSAGAVVPQGDDGRSVASNSSVSTVRVGTSQRSSTVASRTIDLRQELQLTPKSPGEITVTLKYSMPADVVDLKTRVPTRATVISTAGFVQHDSTEYAWDKQTATPTLTYRVAVNETLDVTGPIAGKGDYTFVDPGPWALVRIPPTATGWSWTGGGTVGLSRTTTTAGPGAVGETMAFLGEHREVSRTANGQTFRLIIPAQASLAEPPERIFNSVAAASNTLQVGDRDDHVFMVAAPTTSTRWGVRGLQTGDSDLWVRDVERLNTADNTWLHEYVHTRQGYTASSEVRWFTEASASYYAALLTLEQDRIDFDAFRARLALGTRTPDRSAVLADPATWGTVAPYTKGALVAGYLDLQKRQVTNRTRSLQDVFSRMNSYSGTVTGSTFQEIVRETGSETTASLTSKYTTTQDTPQVWNQTAHSNAFATTPARISYRLPGPETSSGYHVSGPYRTGSVGGEQPIRLAVGETVALEVNVANIGGTAGEYDARLLVNGDLQGQQMGWLDPGKSRTLTFTHRFTSVGDYTLAVGGERVAVSVQKLVKPTVTAVNASKPTRRRGTRYAVSVTVAVNNEHSFPAAANLTLYWNGKPTETRRIELAPNEERTLSYNETLLEPGEHVFRVSDHTATLVVEPTPTLTAKPRTTSTSADRFGVVVTLLAVISLVLVLVRRQ